MYDLKKLKTVDECRRVMERAKQQGRQDVYQSVFRRQCELVGNENDDPTDPLSRRFYETLAAYEQILTEKNGKNTPASRTRQKNANKGVYQSLIEWTKSKIETNGFILLVDAGMPEYTAEFVVAQFGNRFPADVVQLALERLSRHGIAAPKRTQE